MPDTWETIQMLLDILKKLVEKKQGERNVAMAKLTQADGILTESQEVLEGQDATFAEIEELLDKIEELLEEAESEEVQTMEARDWQSWFKEHKGLLFGVLFVLVSIAAIFGYNDWQPPEDLRELVDIIKAIILLLLKVSRVTT